VFPGSEFRVAYEEAFAVGARVVLGDRPVQVTLKRTWARLNTWHRTRLMFGMIFQGFFVPSAEELSQMVEDMKGTDMMTAIIQEMSKEFPSLMDTLVHERDLYMTATLRGVSMNSSSVVAVVGKGHLRGIAENWEKEISVRTFLLTILRLCSSSNHGFACLCLSCVLNFSATAVFIWVEAFNLGNTANASVHSRPGC
jgi:pheromone shutdown protein TraB